MDKSGKRTALITGATGAIGKAIAGKIASDFNFRVILIARDEEKAAKAVRDIKSQTSNQDIEYRIVNLSEPEEIFKLSDKWKTPIDILINNAATTPRSRMENSQGVEIQFATNVLGYFWMTKAFSRYLKQANSARIINVASYWAGGLDLNDLEFKHRTYNNDVAYRQSKQANRMLTVAFSKELINYGITVNACHPGDVDSQLSNNLGFGGHESPEEGARTPVWLAIDDSVGSISGKYFEHMHEVDCRFAHDKNSISKLYGICDSYF